MGAMLGTIGSLYGALGHFISRGEYSGVSCSVKGVKGGDENIFLGTMGVSIVSKVSEVSEVSEVLRVSTGSVDSFWFKK